MKAAIFPIENRVVIRRDTAPEKTSGGLLIPEQARERRDRGTVVAVGPGRARRDGPGREEMQVRPGDDVLFGTFAGAPVEIEDEVFAVVLESDILLILGRSE